MKTHDSIKILVDMGIWDDLVNALKIHYENHQTAIRRMIDSNAKADSIINCYIGWGSTIQGVTFWAEKSRIAEEIVHERGGNES